MEISFWDPVYSPLFKLRKNIVLDKKIVLRLIDKFPEKFTVDELIDKIILIDKIERGNLQSEQGDTITEEELEKEIKKWFPAQLTAT
jgi:hypothetical protein